MRRRLNRQHVLLFVLLSAPGFLAFQPREENDWNMLGGRPSRNAVSSHSRLPTDWDGDEGRNVRWTARLGSQTYASPTVSGDKVFIGTNNDGNYDPGQSGDRGALLAFRASDGAFLWQHTSEKLPSGGVNDWPYVGVCSTPLVEGDRLFFVNNRDELISLDTEGFRDGENDGPYKEETATNDRNADVVWKLDMMDKLGVFPHNASNSSPVVLGDLLFVGTSNGRDEHHRKVPAPQAPSLIAVDKNTGRVVWSDNSPGEGILNGQWTSPTVARIEGVDQVIIGQGDGWVRSFEAKSGRKLWEFDTNPKDSVYPESRNEVLATAVVEGKYVYIANGQDPENGEGEGHLYCIDASKRGDITESGRVWHYDKIRRSISTPVIHEGLIYYPDFSGFLHCLDAATGEVQWVHDTFAAVWGSPLVAGDCLYLGDEDGDVVILKTGRKEELINELNLGGAIYSTPVPAAGALFVATQNRLYALQEQ